MSPARDTSGRRTTTAPSTTCSRSRATLPSMSPRPCRSRSSPPRRGQFAKAGTADQEAYDVYLRGLFHYNTYTEEGLEQASSISSAPSREIPTSPGPRLAGLVLRAFGRFSVFWRPTPLTPGQSGGAPSPRARRLDAEAYTVLALAANYYDYDWVRAEKASAVPSSSTQVPQCPTWYGSVYLSAIGKHDESIADCNVPRNWIRCRLHPGGSRIVVQPCTPLR